MLTKSQAAVLPRRFHKAAAAGAVEGGYGVLLDGRPVRTPAAAPYVLPTLALAAMSAAEWDAQGERIAFADMPITRLAFTAIDGVRLAHEAVAEEAARFAGSDVLCYFADGPEALVAREQAAWRPWLAWASEALDLHLIPVTGVLHQPQPEASLARARELAAAMDDFRLTGLAAAAGLFGSTVLALALERGELDGPAAFALSRLDELFQEELWGVDDEAAVRTARLAIEAEALDRWFKALG